MISLLIFGVFQAVMLIVLLLTKQRKAASDYILGAYLFLSAFIILLAYLEIWNRTNGYPHPWLINLSTPLILVVGPTLWLYIKSLTDQHFRLRRIYLLLLTPFAIVLAMLLARNYLMPDTAKIIHEQTEAFKYDFSFWIIMILIALSNTGYTLWGLLLIRRYRKKIKTFFSKTESIDLSWVRFLLIAALISYASISILYLIDSFLNLMSYHTLQIIGYSIASLLVLALGFFGLKQGSIFSSAGVRFDMEKAIAATHIKPTVEKEEEAFVHKLLSFTKSEKPFLNPDITLASLSKELQVTPEHLSYILNNLLNLNFFDFINHYRIEEFKAQCKDSQNKNLTLISIAYDCGFNSKATFNRVFKKTMGCTPSEFFKSIR
jgi:AraC-like DNA-binding protein